MTEDPFFCLSRAIVQQCYISDIYVASRKGGEEKRREREKDEDINKVAAAAVAALVVIPSYGGRTDAISGVRFC